MQADDEILDNNDEIEDDIDYNQDNDQTLNQLYVNQQEHQNNIDFHYDCGIDLNEQENIINLIGSLDDHDTRSFSSINTPSSISTTATENYDTEPIYETLQPCTSRMSYFSQESSFQNFVPLSSAHEIISSTIIFIFGTQPMLIYLVTIIIWYPL